MPSRISMLIKAGLSRKKNSKKYSDKNFWNKMNDFEIILFKISIPTQMIKFPMMNSKKSLKTFSRRLKTEKNKYLFLLFNNIN